MWLRWATQGLYRILIGKPLGRHPLARPRKRWKDDTERGLTQIMRMFMSNSMLLALTALNLQVLLPP